MELTKDSKLVPLGSNSTNSVYTSNIRFDNPWEEKAWDSSEHPKFVPHKLETLVPFLRELGGKVQHTPPSATTSFSSAHDKQGAIRSSLNVTFGDKRYGVRAEISEFQQYSRSHLKGEPFNADFYHIPEKPKVEVDSQVHYFVKARWSNQKLEMSFSTIEEVQAFLNKLVSHIPVLQGYMTAYDDLRGKTTR
jgi:hypothetical protein